MSLGSLVGGCFSSHSFMFLFILAFILAQRIEFQVIDTGGYFKCRRKDILVRNSKTRSPALYFFEKFHPYHTQPKTMQSIAATDELVKGNE